MSLKAIIFRAEGALADTEDVRRAAYGQVFREAGFAWQVDRLHFAETADLGSTPQRVTHYVRRCLHGRPETNDISLLIQAMHRRADKIFIDRLERGIVDPQPGVRELIVAARAEGVRLILAANMPERTATRLLQSVVGSRALEVFEVVAVCDGASFAGGEAELYSDVVRRLGFDPRHAVVIEGSLSGACAAKSAGFPVLVTRRIHPQEDRAAFPDFLEIEDLPTLISDGNRNRFEPLELGQGGELLAMLHRLHAGNCEDRSELNRNSHMRVADILKSKGSGVKTIEPGATIRALATSLKSEAVGAMLVTDATGKLVGIISERDLARGFADYGDDVVRMNVAELMTTSVLTCTPEDTVAAVARVMTQRRFRHMPVVVRGNLVGIISIGDVLKHRLDEAQLEANVLRDFALARR